MKIRRFIYTKDNGDVSERLAMVVADPRKNYLMYDISSLDKTEIEVLKDTLFKVDEYRENCIKDFELITGKKLNSLWRSFKPEGIEWIEE